jgi:tricorn protease
VHVRHLCVGLPLLLVVSIPVPARAQGTRLLRRPTIGNDLIAFTYASDVWVASRTGGGARRITSTPSEESDPMLSPDGSQIAYSASVAGNTDVYVVPTAGGTPRRLTYHPGGDFVRGWTPDGRSVLFGSTRGTTPTPGANSFFRLWTISSTGGMPEMLPMPRAFTGTFSPDGKRIAYQALSVGMFAENWSENQSSQWRRYRGGRTQPVRIMNLSDYSEITIPWTNSNDTDPMWVGNTVYFLSDRDNTVNLYAYDLGSKQLTQLTHHHDFDIMSASAGADAIVYEQAGYVHVLDLKTRQPRQLAITVKGDFPWARPQMKEVADLIRSGVISPTGVRAAFEARGDIFTISAADDSYRIITQSSDANDRSPVWAPDGAQIAWLSDASGEYQLMIGDQTGAEKPKAIALPSHAFFTALEWSPDGAHLLLRDSGANLWTADVANGRFSRIDTDTYDVPGRSFDAAWSPDSRWVAYSRSLDNHLRAIFLYSLTAGKTYQATDGMADAITPAFDAGGKYLYFLASTNFALNSGWVDMSAMDRPFTRSIYLSVLSASDPSPLLTVAHDEPAAASPRATGTVARARHDTTSAVHVDVDVDGLQRRIVALSVPPGNYGNLVAGNAGTFFYTESPTEAGRGGRSLRLHEYSLAAGKGMPVLDGIASYSLSADRKHMLYMTPRNQWGIVPTDHPAKVGEGDLHVDHLETLVDPRAEWAEIFRDTWRIEREFFYDAKMHGNDWQAIYEKYLPLLPYVEHRADLGYLIASVGGELTVGHSYLEAAGDVPDVAHVSDGVLGADFSVQNGHYRISRIYTEENWNPQLHAPLAAPGLKVAEGDYILGVNGNPLAAPTNLYSLFVGTAGKPTTLRVNSAPTATGSWLVTVVPIASDEALRTRAWIEHNRHVVDSLSGGRLAYVWLPNTSVGGFTEFNRYFFAQQDKDGVIIDERYNQGGTVADYIVDQLSRKLMGYFAERAGKPSEMPMVGIYGPKVMLINESAGSGGDALPYYFHLAGVGPLVGTRTWGGLVGTIGVPPTLDNGGITAPDLAFYDLNGKWAVENEGIEPDIEVHNTPSAVIAGHDPQLERGVAEALRLLQQHPVPHVPRPAPINRVTPGSQQ